MSNFIEFNYDGTKRLVNLRGIQEIVKNHNGKGTIFFSDKEYFTPDEDYDDIIDMLYQAGLYWKGYKKHE